MMRRGRRFRVENYFTDSSMPRDNCGLCGKRLTMPRKQSEHLDKQHGLRMTTGIQFPGSIIERRRVIR